MGRADLHLHTLASDGTAGVLEILEHVEAETDLDVIAITDHDRIDAALAARAIAADRGMRAEVIVGEEVSSLGGHVLALFVDTADPPAPHPERHGCRDPRRGRRGDPRPSAGPVPAVRAGLGHPRAARPIRRAVPPRRPGDVQPDDARPAMALEGGPLRRGERPGHGRQQRRARARRDRCRVDRVPGPDRGRPARRHRRPRDGLPAGRSTGRRARSARSGASSRSTAAMRTRGSRAGSCAMAPVATSAIRPSTVRSTRRGDEDRPRLPVHLPRRRRRRAARGVPLREPPPARPRRADHHRQPRPAALVGG